MASSMTSEHLFQADGSYTPEKFFSRFPGERAAGGHHPIRRSHVSTVTPPALSLDRVRLDKPIYTISVASEILETHPRTLMMYEQLDLVVPHRTTTNRRRYSQRDLLTLQAIQRLTREHRLNLAGARYVIQCLRLLDEHGIKRPEFLADLDVTHARL